MNDEMMLVSPIISFGSYIVVTFFILGSFIFYGLYASIGSTIGFCIAYYCAKKNVFWALEINKNVSFAFFVGFWGGIFGLLWYWIYYATNGSGLFLSVSLLLVFGVIGSTMFVGDNILDEYGYYDPIEPYYEPITPALVDEKEEKFIYENDPFEIVDYGDYEIKTLKYEIKSSGSPVRLFNYKDAKDPSWEELVNFIEEDSTDKQPYIDDLFDCNDFAEMLHNNAEAAHIRAAWVGIFYIGEEYGHALNAFSTSDKGLVYVDCTGFGFFKDIDIVNEDEYCSCDRIAYVLNGSEYGLISLDEVESSEYWSYENYIEKWISYWLDIDLYDAKMREYNRSVEAYKRDIEIYEKMIGDRTYISDSDEYERLSKMYKSIKLKEDMLERSENSLDGLYNELVEQEDEIGYCYWKSLGVVSNIEIYW